MSEENNAVAVREALSDMRCGYCGYRIGGPKGCTAPRMDDGLKVYDEGEEAEGRTEPNQASSDATHAPPVSETNRDEKHSKSLITLFLKQMSDSLGS